MGPGHLNLTAQSAIKISSYCALLYMYISMFHVKFTITIITVLNAVARPADYS